MISVTFGRYSKDTSFEIDGGICYNMQVIKHNIRKIHDRRNNKSHYKIFFFLKQTATDL